VKLPPIKENFNQEWQERVLVEFDIVNSADLGALREGLKERARPGEAANLAAPSCAVARPERNRS
jgi:hypothetical protein